MRNHRQAIVRSLLVVTASFTLLVPSAAYAAQQSQPKTAVSKKVSTTTTTKPRLSFSNDYRNANKP